MTKKMTVDEDELGKHLPSFIIYQAKNLGETSTSVIEGGVTFTWHIKYQPN